MESSPGSGWSTEDTAPALHVNTADPAPAIATPSIDGTFTRHDGTGSTLPTETRGIDHDDPVHMGALDGRDPDNPKKTPPIKATASQQLDAPSSTPTSQHAATTIVFVASEATQPRFGDRPDTPSALFAPQCFTMDSSIDKEIR